MRVTVSGSFTKHWAEIQVAVKELQELGATVLSPKNGPPAWEDSGFVYLRDDAGGADAIERRHLDAIQQSDLLYLVNPGGYLGNSAAMEIGYALAWHTAIWSSEKFSNSPHSLLVKPGSVREAVQCVSSHSRDPEIPSKATLDELQAYWRQMSEARGFSNETLSDVFVLLTEEIGELAKALRSRLHLAMSASDKSSKNIELELADCFIYILHFANTAGVNLLAAFREKERLNSRKSWAKS